MSSRASLSVTFLVCALAGCGDDANPEETTNSDGGTPLGDSAVAASDGSAGGTSDASGGGSSDAGGGNPSRDGGKEPQGDWKNVTANLANMDSECGNLSTLAVQPSDGRLIAGIALHGLWASDNGGQSWTALGTGAGSASITNRPSSIVFDPTAPSQFWETGIYNGGGIYKTTDNGTTFSALPVVNPNDAAMSIDRISIDFADPQRKLMLVGGHERAQQVFRSQDSGATWTNIGTSLTKQCNFPLVLDTSTYLVGCSYGDQGIYRTADKGATWTLVSETGGTNAPLLATDKSIYWPLKDNGGLLRSTDNGLTWSKTTGSGTLLNVTPIELPDGRLAAVGSTALVVSSDQGKTWVAVSKPLPYSDLNGFVYSPQQKAFFIKHWSCGNGSVPVPPDAIMRWDYDYQAP